jgi:hypothetical protein
MNLQCTICFGSDLMVIQVPKIVRCPVKLSTAARDFDTMDSFPDPPISLTQSITRIVDCPDRSHLEHLKLAGKTDVIHPFM